MCDLKNCKTCKRYLPLTQFKKMPRSYNPDYISPNCIECRRRYNKVWKRNRSRRQEIKPIEKPEIKTIKRSGIISIGSYSGKEAFKIYDSLIASGMTPDKSSDILFNLARG